MSEEKVNTQPAETNSEPNNSTQAVDKNDVPYGRFQEVNQAKNQFKSENEELKEQLAKVKAGQEQAREEVLKKNSEFETLYNEQHSLNKNLSEKLQGFEKREAEEAERLDSKIPEEHKVFTQNMSNAVKAQYIEKLNSNLNAGKADTSRAGTTAKGEFGGYDSYVEWAEKDPVSYEKEKRNTIGQGIKIAYTGN